MKRIYFEGDGPEPLVFFLDAVGAIKPHEGGTAVLVQGQWFIFPNISYRVMVEKLGVRD